MTIISKIVGSIAPAGRAAPTDRTVTAHGRGGAAAPRATPASIDSVQISDAGRAKSLGGPAISGVTPERSAEIHHRILSGAYNSLDIVAEVAARVLDRPSPSGEPFVSER